MKNKVYLPSKNTKTHTNPIIAQTIYMVSEVTHDVVTANLHFEEPILTWLPNIMSKRGAESISVEEFARRLNSYKKLDEKTEKINNSDSLDLVLLIIIYII